MLAPPARTRLFAQLLVVGVVLSSPALAAVRFANVFGNGMVLESGPGAVVFWGFSGVGDDIVVEFDGQKQTVKANAKGIWEAEFDAPAAGFDKYGVTAANSAGSQQAGETTVASLSDVLFGDVFLCSGQSNMFWRSSVTDVPEELYGHMGALGHIRLFQAALKTSSEPLDELIEVTTAWTASTNATVQSFSAVCWATAAHLSLLRAAGGEDQVPIGLLHTSWGGTKIERWCSPEALAKCQELRPKELPSRASGAEFPPAGAKTPAHLVDHRDPAGVRNAQLWNAMIHPFLRHRLSGALWYQGESNLGATAYYACQFPAMIADWRKRFRDADGAGGNGDDPMFFGFVHLSAYKAQQNTRLAELRQAQEAAMKMPNVGLAMSLDAGEDDFNIHPRFKSIVGLRLGRSIRAMVDKDASVVRLGPEAVRARGLEGRRERIVVQFREGSVDGGLAVDDAVACPPGSQAFCTAFELSPDNGESWKAATAQRIGSHSVVVESAGMALPTHVRYAWSDFPRAVLVQKNAPHPGRPFLLKVD